MEGLTTLESQMPTSPRLETRDNHKHTADLPDAQALAQNNDDDDKTINYGDYDDETTIYYGDYDNEQHDDDKTVVYIICPPSPGYPDAPDDQPAPMEAPSTPLPTRARVCPGAPKRRAPESKRTGCRRSTRSRISTAVDDAFVYF